LANQHSTRFKQKGKKATCDLFFSKKMADTTIRLSVGFFKITWMYGKKTFSRLLHNGKRFATIELGRWKCGKTVWMFFVTKKNGFDRRQKYPF
jgi:hypothetical protein